MNATHAPTCEQKRFAKHTSEVFVSACPGSGKTRAILDRLEILLKNLPPRRGIGVLSFTQSAMEEFRDRSRKSGLHRVLLHPHFVGTFDAFVRHFLVTPSGVKGRKGTIRPHIVDSWETLGCRVQVKGIGGIGPFLDSFDPQTGLLELERIKDGRIHAVVAKAKEKFEQRARLRRKFLNEQGYLSAADARLDALRKVQDEKLGPTIGRAIAARFFEIFVDEGQDCNPQDAEILRWLRRCGVRVTLLADPDQSIYGFRYGNPETLTALASEYAPGDRLPFTGNFRCSPAICALAATFRGPGKSQPDESLGESAAVKTPIKMLAYEGNKPTEAIGRRFAEILSELKIKREDAMILAHEWSAVRNAIGENSADKEPGVSRVETMARAIATYRSTAARPRQRLTALQSVERIILEMSGELGRDEPLTHAIESRRIDERILRRKAVALASEARPAIGQSEAERVAWVQELQASTTKLGIQMPKGKSPKSFFRAPKAAKWSAVLRAHEKFSLNVSSIHEAKGHQYRAVCVVIPPKGERTEELVKSWEERTEAEPKRVIYVGVTRAIELVVLAVPVQYASRIESILCVANVPYDPQECLLNPARGKPTHKRKSNPLRHKDQQTLFSDM